MLAASSKLIRRRDGAPCELAVSTRILSPADLDAVYGLHLGVMRGIEDSDLVRTEARGFFEALLGGTGQILGLFCAAELIAYGVLELEILPEEHPGSLLSLPEAARLAKLAGTSVRHEYRGNQLQLYLVEQRLLLARRLGYQHAFATSSPKNHFSWMNLVRGGLVIGGLRRMYGGFVRYVLHADLEKPFEPDPATLVECRTNDAGRQELLTAAGYRGFSFDAKLLRTICFAKRLPR